MNRAERRQAVRDQRNRRSTSAQPTVTIGVPHRGVTDEFFDCFTNLLVSNTGVVSEVITVSGALVAAARNTIVRRALDRPAEWILQLDSDMTFGPDLIAGLLAHADPVERPIIGGLCFKVHRSGDVEPVIYRLQTEPTVHLQTVTQWGDGNLVEVDATGAACLLVHRSVYEKIDDGSHSPWFDDADLAGERIGEDMAFCLNARKAGFPIYVATALEVGHTKSHSFGVGEWRRQRRELHHIPTFVVIPVRDADDPVPVTRDMVSVRGDVFVIPNDHDGAVPNIPRKWNMGLRMAAADARERGLDKWNVLFLNDDVELAYGLVNQQLSEALRSDPSYALAYPNSHGFEGSGVVVTRTDDPGGLTFSGWCFMVRGESAMPFDERYAWWFSDNDYELRIARAGKQVACVLDCHVDHLRPNEATFASPVLREQIEKDEALFCAEHGIEPSLLRPAPTG